MNTSMRSARANGKGALRAAAPLEASGVMAVGSGAGCRSSLRFIDDDDVHSHHSSRAP